jgi:hypothetical protein
MAEQRGGRVRGKQRDAIFEQADWSIATIQPASEALSLRESCTHHGRTSTR